MHVVIIGNGIGGNAAAFKIREYNQDTKITIISGENSQSYDPGALPYYVSADVSRDKVFLKKEEDYYKKRIGRILGNKVTKIDTEERKVYLNDIRTIGYDRLIIAAGGKMIVPPIKGIGLKGVFCCKTLEDADRLKEHQGKCAVVIGSGLIGIEAGEALKKKGYEVWLIELMDWIMPKVFDQVPALMLADSLEKNGIRVLTGEKVLCINGKSDVASVTTDRREIKCDTVILATGVIPSGELAGKAGIELALSKGIKVDNQMMTSVPDVYACGDCVETPDAFTGEKGLFMLRHNALEQAEVIVGNILGKTAYYRGAWGFTRAHFFDTHAVSLGKTAASFADLSDVEIIEKKRREEYVKLIICRGKLVGAQLIGRETKKAGILLGAMWRQDDLNLMRTRWETISSINSPYPWIHRVVGKYMNL